MYFRRLDSANRYPQTRRLVPVLQRYGPDGMSEDASNHANGTGRPSYEILDHSWRNPYAASCFRTLDALHRDNRFRPVRRAGPGAQPHNRILSNVKSTSPPVPGLPRSYYDGQWLQRQSLLVRESLQVQEEAEDFVFAHDPYIAASVPLFNGSQIPVLTRLIRLASTNNGQLDSMWNYA